jgi:hypothetical protein
MFKAKLIYTLKCITLGLSVTATFAGLCYIIFVTKYGLLTLLGLILSYVLGDLIIFHVERNKIKKRLRG